MSGEGPESIPTSADPRSRRPTKRRALTPSTEQSTSINALFARPDQEIRIPAAGGAGDNNKRRHLPPEIVTNVQGSSAGAGSGEFHVYKASRRREYERLKAMEDEVKKEKSQEDFDRERLERAKKDEEKTRKNREKREKIKARKAKVGKGGNGGGGGAPTPKAHVSTGGCKPHPVSGPGAGAGAATDENNDMSPDVGNNHGAQEARNGDANAPASSSQPVGLVIHDDD